MTAKSKSLKIVYYLGAGASWHALPVISEMEERFHVFLDFFHEYRSTIDSRRDAHIYDFIDTKKDNKWYKLLLKLKEEPTIDTLARIAFLSENDLQVIDIKQFLSAYLLWEQTIDVENENILKWQPQNNKLEPELKERITKHKGLDKEKFEKRNLDFRYTSLFSSFCNSRFEMNKDMSVISWNYDSQVEMSLAKTFGIYEYCKKLNSDGDDNAIQDFYEHKFSEVFNGFDFIKLNGNISTQNRTWELPLKFDILNNEEAIIAEYDKIWNLIFNEGDYPNNIHFAWENSEIIDANREKAKTLMSEADCIVVIGYSFPQYNRDIDREIWSLVRRNSSVNKNGKIKVIIQDTPENAVRIKSRLQSIFDYRGIDIYTDLDQFYIP